MPCPVLFTEDTYSSYPNISNSETIDSVMFFRKLACISSAFGIISRVCDEFGST